MIYKNYSNSKLATFISVLGGLFVAMGVYLAFELISDGDTEEGIVGAVILGVIGFAFNYLASRISFNKWKKTIEEKGLHIRAMDPVQGLEVCKVIYQSNSNSNQALKYIETLNPQAAQIIAQAVKRK